MIMYLEEEERKKNVLTLLAATKISRRDLDQVSPTEYRYYKDGGAPFLSI